MELDSQKKEDDEDENGGEGLGDHLKQVIESPPRVLFRDFLISTQSLKCALQNSSGVLQDHAVPLPNCGFSS